MHNKWLRKDLVLMKELFEDGRIAYDVVVILDGAFYRLLGNVDKDIFQKMVEGLSF